MSVNTVKIKKNKKYIYNNPPFQTQLLIYLSKTSQDNKLAK